MGEKNWPKSAKKCQKEPKFVFRARGPLPACWPEGPAPEAPRLPAEDRQAMILIFLIWHHLGAKHCNRSLLIVVTYCTITH